MRILLVLAIAFVISGCAGKRNAQPQAAGRAGADGPNASPGANSSNQQLIVTPDNALAGKVAWVNTAGRFVVLNFPVGHLPAVEQHLNLYRRGSKVGEVKVTGPQNDDNVVADLLAGDSEIGDQVRDK